MNKELQRLYRLQAEVIQAAGHPIRLAIIDCLKDGEQCVCDIAEHVAAERSNVSRHLSVLLRAGVLEHRKEGLRMLYRLRCRCVVDFLSCVTNVLREQVQASSAALRAL